MSLARLAHKSGQHRLGGSASSKQEGPRAPDFALCLPSLTYFCPVRPSCHQVFPFLPIIVAGRSRRWPKAAPPRPFSPIFYFYRLCVLFVFPAALLSAINGETKRPPSFWRSAGSPLTFFLRPGGWEFFASPRSLLLPPIPFQNVDFLVVGADFEAHPAVPIAALFGEFYLFPLSITLSP